MQMFKMEPVMHTLYVGLKRYHNITPASKHYHITLASSDITCSELSYSNLRIVQFTSMHIPFLPSPHFKIWGQKQILNPLLHYWIFLGY